ncbi:MAG: hypothetical protein ACRDSL_01875 [Pseudonocardiaceae bacterium]
MDTEEARAIECGQSAGLVLPVAELQDQVRHLHRQRRACRFSEVATELPALIRNVHTSLNVGTDHGELLELAVYLHVHVTRIWLGNAAAPAHLQRRVVFLAHRLAQEREEVTTLAVAGLGLVNTLLAGGAVMPGRAALDSLTLPPTTAGTAGVVCALTTMHALAAVRQERPDDAAPALDTAAELAQRFGAAPRTPSLHGGPGPVLAALRLRTGQVGGPSRGRGAGAAHGGAHLSDQVAAQPGRPRHPGRAAQALAPGLPGGPGAAGHGPPGASARVVPRGCLS